MGNVDIPENPILCMGWVCGVLLIAPFALLCHCCSAMTLPVVAASNDFRKDKTARHIHPLKTMISGGGSRNRSKARPQARDQRQSKFLHSLPVEIRAQILAMVLCRPEFEYRRIILNIDKPRVNSKVLPRRRFVECTTLYEDHHWITRRSAPAIVLTCRQAFYESLPVLYGQNKFHFFPEFYFNTPTECWLTIDRLNQFGDSSALTLIPDLQIEMPVVECMFSCRRCRKAGDAMWQRLYDMKELRQLGINLKTSQGGSFPGERRQCPALSTKADLDSFKAKLLGLSQVQTVSLYVMDDRQLRSRIADMELDSERFKIVHVPATDFGVTTYGRVFESQTLKDLNVR